MDTNFYTLVVAIVGVLWSIASELVPLFPKLQANNVVKLIVNIIKWLYENLKKSVMNK